MNKQTLNIDFIIEFVTLFKKKYENKLLLRQFYIIHCPAYIKNIYSFVKGMVHKDTRSKIKLVKIFNDLKKKNKKIIGYGASAKAVTIINYCNLKEDYFEYFFDTTKQKINKLLPGTKIKVKKYKKLKDVKKYVFLGAWNFYNEIVKKEDYFFHGLGKFITHVPYPRIIHKKINFRKKKI